MLDYANVRWLFELCCKFKIPRGIIYALKRICFNRYGIVRYLIANNLYSKKLDYKYCMSAGERADIDGDYVKAVSLYRSGDGQRSDTEDYINLAHLLWRFTSDCPGRLCNDFNLGEVLEGSDDLLDDVLNCIINKGLSEGNFWKEYYRLNGNWKAHSEEEWLDIIKSSRWHYNNAMYFVCYLYDKEKYASEIADFLEECDRCPTALNLYIKEQIKM